MQGDQLVYYKPVAPHCKLNASFAYFHSSCFPFWSNPLGTSLICQIIYLIKIHQFTLLASKVRQRNFQYGNVQWAKFIAEIIG